MNEQTNPDPVPGILYLMAEQELRIQKINRVNAELLGACERILELFWKIPQGNQTEAMHWCVVRALNNAKSILNGTTADKAVVGAGDEVLKLRAENAKLREGNMTLSMRLAADDEETRWKIYHLDAENAKLREEMAAHIRKLSGDWDNSQVEIGRLRARMPGDDVLFAVAMLAAAHDGSEHSALIAKWLDGLEAGEDD